MVFQHFNLFPNMTIRENICLAPVKLKLMTKEEASKKADEKKTSTKSDDTKSEEKPEAKKAPAKKAASKKAAKAKEVSKTTEKGEK
mgnify:CR=1 FL=1